MFRTDEIRWFFKKESWSLLKAFHAMGGDSANGDSRTDHYLYLPPRDDIGVKIREGQVEIKHRVKINGKKNLSRQISGLSESWIKWSFSADPGDPLLNEIVKGESYRFESTEDPCWIPVLKTRYLIFAQKDEKGELHITHSEPLGDSGLQIEYSRIRVHEEDWFSFALEWFGGSELQPSVIFNKQIFNEVSLPLEESMGYSAFLNRLG
ncbi:hypothetical protein [Robertkochia aurantiaca]|uniref:hypothetical protein n=1 Tax=Robertkochia aurantiaca TaxID=2873700 RepID=UPI001CCDF051|nr:hypothetical protein [Robertkochia sp. 3YJGBD-33]